MSGRAHSQLVELPGGRVMMVPREPSEFLQPADNNAGVDTVDRGKSVELLVMQGDNSPTLVTLCLIRRDEPLPGQTPADVGFDCPLRALIRFGASGVSEECRVDWINGLFLTVPSASVSVTAEYPATSTPNPVEVRQRVAVIANTVARPPAAGGISQARLTDRWELTAGNNQLFEVPPRATAFRLFTTVPSMAGSFTVEVFDTPSAARSAEWAFAPANLEEMPLATGNRAVRVTNGTAGTRKGALQWTISL